MQALKAPLNAGNAAHAKTFSTDKLTIVCWKWKPSAPRGCAVWKQGPEHVNILRRMVARNLKIPHEFVCITDDPAGIDDDIRIIPLWPDLRSEGYCMVRLKAFTEEMREIIGPRFAWVDVDVVITRDITPIFDTDADFKISGVELRAQPYNGSVVLMNAGARKQVYHEFDPARFRQVKAEKKYGGSDQAWIAVCLGEDEQVWTEEDGLYNYRDHIDPAKPQGSDGELPENARIVIFNGRFDPSMPELQAKSPWILEHWR